MANGKQELQLESDGYFHRVTVRPGLSSGQLNGLRAEPPFKLRVHKYIFQHETGELAGWPYDNVVTDTSDETVLCFSEELLDYTRQSTPEEIARKIAVSVGGVFLNEQTVL